MTLLYRGRQYTAMHNNRTRRAASRRLVVVDVQPCYRDFLSFDVYRFAEFLNSYEQVLVFFNGEDICCNSLSEIEDMYEEMGIDISNITFVEKGYGFLRDFMDHGMGHDAIAGLVAYMIANDVSDSRDLADLEDPPPVVLEVVDELGLDDVEELENSDLVIGLPNMQVEGEWAEPDAFLPLWNGADIVGGGCQECLLEIEILAQGLGVRFNRIGEFVYG